MLEQTEHKFNYNWTLKNANFIKDKGTVFSCFACGGDAYAGSFSTAIACYKEKRKFIGCEILPKYFEKAMKRLEWEQRTQYLF